MYRIISFISIILIPLLSSTIHAETWTLPPSEIDVFGQIKTTVASREDTLLDIARRHDIGQTEILLANPKVDRWLPVDGTKVILPNRYIIPQAERKGLVLNLPEMRLYYFPKSKKGEKPRIITHPVSIGRMDWETPLGKTKIVGKKKNPTWTPPQSLKDEAITQGDPPLPDIVPAGPDNPLGLFALRLGVQNGSYLIHGTNKPFGVGMRVSHGCVRMYPEDIESLFGQIPIGTTVQLINQPIKVGWLVGSLFVELHPPLEEETEKYRDYDQKVKETITEFLTKASTSDDQHAAAIVNINLATLKQAITEKSGLPVLISD